MIRVNDLHGKFFGALLCVFIIMNFWSVPYMLIEPGAAQELSPIIEVPDGYKENTEGEFMLTVVQSSRATVMDYIKYKITGSKNIRLDPIEEYLPEGFNINDYIASMEIYMINSQKQSQYVAFKKAGLDADLVDTGVVVLGIFEYSSAFDVLKEGDIIKKVDNKDIQNNQEAIDIIRSHEIGETVDVKLDRDGEILDFEIITIEIEENPGKASLGIQISTKQEFKFPKEVIFKTEKYGGPSAGSMFALEIYNQLLPEDLTKGKYIAGTGTIDIKGNIGPIDGVRQKVIGAEKRNAEIFFCPEENYEEALETASTIEVVMVKTFDDMLNFLESKISYSYLISGVVKSSRDLRLSAA